MDCLQQIALFESAWLTGKIRDDIAESPEHNEAIAARRLRNAQKRSNGLPDFEYLITKRSG